MITLKRLAVASYKGIRALDLTFPERGSILIEGRNEAGKSTLFDAVHYALYGVPMVGDLGAALHYGAEQMEVRLELAVSGTQLHAWRRTRADGEVPAQRGRPLHHPARRRGRRRRSKAPPR